jgi:tetratricopeptide (TPR) repeat protein
MKNESTTNKNSHTLNQRGIELANRGWLEEAIKDFNQAIALDSDSPFPLINRASVLVEQGKYLDGLSDLLKAVNLAPDEPSAHYHLGVFFSKFGSNLAIDELQTALNQDPEQIDALIQLGVTFSDRGESQSAQETLQAALEQDSQDPVANHEMGILMMDDGDPHQAIGYLKRAWIHLGFDPQIGSDLSLAYIQAGFYEKAEDIINQILKEDAKNIQSHYNLAAIAADRKNVEQCLLYLQNACSHNSKLVSEWIQDDKMFDKIRTNPKFEKFVFEIKSSDKLERTLYPS